jgi:hypothetical protein
MASCKLSGNWIGLLSAALLFAASGGKVAVAAGTPPTPLGTATLSWTAPTKNADGSLITALAGYHIYYGTDPHNFTQTIRIKGAAHTTYVVLGLTAGKYYFAVSAYNAMGRESVKSNVVSKSI